LGLGGLVSTFSRWEAIEKLEIYGGQWTLERVKDLLLKVVLRGEKLPIKLEFIPLQPGLIMEDSSFQLSAFPVVHRGLIVLGFSLKKSRAVPFSTRKPRRWACLLAGTA